MTEWSSRVRPPLLGSELGRVAAGPAPGLFGEPGLGDRTSAAGQASPPHPQPELPGPRLRRHASHENALLYPGVPAAARRAGGPLHGAPGPGAGSHRAGTSRRRGGAHLLAGLSRDRTSLCLQLYSVYLDGFLFCRVRYSQLHRWNEQVSGAAAGTSSFT